MSHAILFNIIKHIIYKTCDGVNMDPLYFDKDSRMKMVHKCDLHGAILSRYIIPDNNIENAGMQFNIKSYKVIVIYFIIAMYHQNKMFHNLLILMLTEIRCRTSIREK